ncbi:glutamine synthetase family protein [Salinisphaera sp. LB1]|uniref:glutamine synthetase family protein n=1 Tax=Salinisphaera sp. LB1 TaxID=2183911 RepID=UPI000D706A71|nr:glutamine synthetase family protein [Salinisphaera sp. LB1]AWN16052.1 glutamine synthetase family protein [Salinisphaera sp. LB1]
MPHTDLPADARAVIDAMPELEFIEAYIVDINGIARGKRLPAASLARVYSKGLNLPVSTPLLDIWGHEVEDTGLAIASGDADRPCLPVEGSLRPMPWSTRGAAQMLLMMHEPDGSRFAGDPRAILATVVDRLAARGLTPVVATELEFRLFEAEPDATGRPVPAQLSTRPGRRSQLYGIEELDNLDDLFGDIEAACVAQGLPMDTLISEQGEAQYEINLEHVGDALLAADQTILLKRTIKACARRHGLAASFMAKPFGDSSGNGMHAHISLLDRNGDNIFADNHSDNGALMQCVAGLLETMAESTAIFAPHDNSFRRFQAASHAPLAPAWGVDNRTTAIRLPLAEPAAARIEHRVAGADANPYLVLATVLGGMEHGMARQLVPPPETVGDAYSQHEASLPDAWGTAIEAFEESSFIAEYLGADYQRWYAAAKRQERECLRAIVPAAEYDAYLRTV